MTRKGSNLIAIGRGREGAPEVLFVVFDDETGAGLHPRDRTPPFGAALSGAALEAAGIGSRLLELSASDVKRGDVPELRGVNAGVVAVEAGARHEGFLERLRPEVRERGGSLALFGLYSGMSADSILTRGLADFCVVGEAEAALPGLAERLISGGGGAFPPGVKWLEPDGGIGFSGPSAPVNTDDMPFLPLPVLTDGRYRKNSFPVAIGRPLKWGFALGNRGCRFSCRFCTAMTRQSLRKEYRLCSPERLFEEMKYQVERGGRTIISVEDDLFTGNREWTLRFCELLEKNGWATPWIMQTRFDCLDDEVLAALKRAGCAGMTCGMESGSDRVLEALGKRETVETIRRTGKLINKYGFATRYTTMIGSPGETEADARMTAALVRELNPTVVQMSFCTPYADTELAKEAGLRSGDRRFEDPAAGICALSADRLKRIRLKFYAKHYFSLSYLRGHAAGAAKYLIENPRIAAGQNAAFASFVARQALKTAGLRFVSRRAE